MDKLDLVIDKIEQHSKHMEHRLKSIDGNLEEHMRRTDALEKLHQQNEDRIEKLEVPGKSLMFIKKSALFIAALAGAAVTILKLISK